MKSTAYNRVYPVRTAPSLKFLASLGTSDILKPLGRGCRFLACSGGRELVKNRW